MGKKLNKSRRLIYVLAGVLVMSVVCTGAAYDVVGVDVTITEIDEIRNIENTVTVRTRENDVNKIIEDNNLGLGLYDKINYDDYHIIEGGEEIVIRRGVGITVEVDGTIVTTSSTADTVGEALVENGIFIDELDYTIPSIDSTISENEVIKIVRVNSYTETKEETIPFETIYKDDSSMTEGKTKVITEGVTGKIRITENVVQENGAEISREEVLRETVVEKVDKVVARGTAKKKKVEPVAKAEKKSNTASKPETKKSVTESTEKNEAKKKETSDQGFEYTKKLTMTATAYSAFKKDGSYGKTASGMTAKYGVVAVDPKVIPLGTKLYVEGYGYAVAGDTGGVIKGNKIDLCFEKPNSELMAFGRKSLTVYILE